MFLWLDRACVQVKPPRLLLKLGGYEPSSNFMHVCCTHVHRRALADVAETTSGGSVKFVGGVGVQEINLDASGAAVGITTTDGRIVEVSMAACHCCRH